MMHRVRNWREVFFGEIDCWRMFIAIRHCTLDTTILPTVQSYVHLFKYIFYPIAPIIRTN